MRPDLPDMPVGGVNPTNPIKPISPEPTPTGPDDMPSFNLEPSGPLPKGPAGKEPQPSPMQVSADESRKHQQMTPEELQDKGQELVSKLNEAQKQLQNPAVANKLTVQHQEALQKLTEKMTHDMKNIAEYSGGKFAPAKGGSLLSHVSNWIGASQETMKGAITHLNKIKNPNLTDFLKLQYSMQRASQRAELFSSIIGSSVSGIKTIMSTQLG